MWEQTGGTENKPVKLSTICAFGRMRRFKPYAAVVKALQESNFLAVSGSEGAEVLKRRKPYELNSRGKAEAATLYVKGFGDETPTTQFDLEAFFTRHFPVNAVRLRRTQENFFKGSVFVEFQDAGEAKKFLELDPAPSFNGHPLRIMFKRAYCDEKAELIREGKIEPNPGYKRIFFEGKTKNGKPIDKDNWKDRRDRDQNSNYRGRGNGQRGGRGNFRGGRGRGGFRGRGRGGHQDRNVKPERSADDW